MGKSNTSSKSITSITGRKKTFNTFQKGMSLIEILVVIGIFSILSILTTRSIVLTLSGSKKTETLIKVRENLNYSLGVMERQLRNSDAITDCTNTNTLAISYKDINGQNASFSCSNIGAGIGYVSWNSERLTADTLDVTGCSFTCETDSAGNPQSVKIELDGQDTIQTGVNNSSVNVTSSVTLRTY